jgi:hypothetical protein
MKMWCELSINITTMLHAVKEGLLSYCGQWGLAINISHAQ